METGAKTNWYRDGDRNTRFFHLCASQRRRRNRILEVRDSDAILRTGQVSISKVFETYFASIFCSTQPSSESIKDGLADLSRKITSEMNQDLDKHFVRAEVDLALSQMVSFKSPGPDGFGPCFFQDYWCIVGDRVATTVLDFLNFGQFDEEMNRTNLVLIPKLDKPKSVSDFRPISLCNVVYKLMAKTLANRLKKILHEIIYYNQSAFIPSRLIYDNIMIAYEVIHTMKTRLRGKKGSVAMKLDMSKAYDRM